MPSFFQFPLQPTTADFIRRLISEHRKLVLAALACALMAAAFEGATMGIFALALRYLASSGAEATASQGLLGRLAESLQAIMGKQAFFPLLVALGVTTQVLRSGARLAGDLATARMISSVEGGTRIRLFRQCIDMTFASAQKYRVGDLSSLFEHVTYLGLAVQRIGVVFGQVALLGVYSIILFWLSWKITLLGLTGMLLLLLILQGIIKKVQAAADSFKAAVVFMNAQVVEFLHSLRLLHSFGRRQFATERIERSVKASVRSRRRALSWQALLAPLVDALAVSTIGTLLILGYLRLQATDAEGFAQFATFLFVLYRMVPRFSVINKNWGLFHNYLPFVNRMADFLLRSDKEYPCDGEQVFSNLTRGIEFQNVSFVYGGSKVPALDGVSFRISKGSTTALVGESGAGKTTAADLALGLYRPTSGQILVDDSNLESFQHQSWLDRAGVVGQETFLLYDSVYNNIVFGREDVGRKDVERAARRANAHDFILELPDGYETQIGQRGYRLSGGQRQRLAIARAILRQPDLLILDEATSDLDSQSESLIQESLRSLRKTSTVLIIAHRLSTIASADQILFLEAGRLVEAGTHRELLDLPGRYSRFWELQTGTAPENDGGRDS